MGQGQGPDGDGSKTPLIELAARGMLHHAAETGCFWIHVAGKSKAQSSTKEEIERNACLAAPWPASAQRHLPELRAPIAGLILATITIVSAVSPPVQARPLDQHRGRDTAATGSRWLDVCGQFPTGTWH
ncbi:hypothetical protein OPT61_g8896 [Boeremia exigua]|uniref:Uncharacterized protein n=1 Tax=Boeremia exigua TaxID=749465 RepID=A0ACC2HWL2_9PLEO|nr:hypothetical protein OPT61_g8896 [Boeremia exigua]